MAVPLQTLCQCDKDRALTVRIYDWEKSGDHIPIGICTVRYFLNLIRLKQ
jgi:hypothetical protein